MFKVKNMPEYTLVRLHQYFIAILRKNQLIEAKDYPEKNDMRYLYKHKAKRISKKQKQLVQESERKCFSENKILTTSIMEKYFFKLERLSSAEAHNICLMPSNIANEIFIEGNIGGKNNKILFSDTFEKVSF